MDFTVSCPGKVILHGEHSVVYGRTAVAGSISNLRTRVRVCASVLKTNNHHHHHHHPHHHPQHHYNHKHHPHLLVHLPDLGPSKRISWTLQELLSMVQGFRIESSLERLDTELVSRIVNAVGGESGIVACLYLYFSILPLKLIRTISLEMTVSSSIPIGAGLGSSGAFNVALSAAFHLLKIQLESDNDFPSTMIKKKTFFERNELQSICQMAFLSESFMHGKASGIDNSICTYGGLLSFKTGKIHPFHLNSSTPIRVLLINTKVCRNTRALVDKVRNKVSLLPKVTASILEAMERISLESLENLKRLNQCDQKSKLEIFQKLEGLISINHDLLCAFGVSHASLNKIVEVSNAYGISAKMTGAGGGGFALALLTPNHDHARIERLKAELINNGFECWESDIGGTGVSIDV